MTLGGEASTIMQGGDIGADALMKRQRDRIAELRRANEQRAALLVELIEHIHGNEHSSPSWAKCNKPICRDVQMALPSHAQDAREDDDYGSA
jgi:hypothetical protein